MLATSIVSLLLSYAIHLEAIAPTISASSKYNPKIRDVKIECNDHEMHIVVETSRNHFNGMIYPKSLSRNSSCLAEMVRAKSPLHYRLPLRSCNTMSTYLDDGTIEYYNTIIVQPHLKLVTNQGKEFDVRCRYDIRENIIISDDGSDSSFRAKPLISAKLPPIAMKILHGTLDSDEVAKDAKIGDPLTLSVEVMDAGASSGAKLGLQVIDCKVRDGIGVSEQRLIDGRGCPLDSDLMSVFKYSAHFDRAMVPFQAHKFPYTKSVYYQCHVRLCDVSGGRCRQLSDGECETVANRKEKRQANFDVEEVPAVIEVYSGLFVNEDPKEDVEQTEFPDDVFSEKTSDAICISQRKFAIGLVLTGLTLMLIAILAILCIITRRSRKMSSRTGSSIYSGPYTNTSYSRTS